MDDENGDDNCDNKNICNLYLSFSVTIRSFSMGMTKLSISGSFPWVYIHFGFSNLHMIHLHCLTSQSGKLVSALLEAGSAPGKIGDNIKSGSSV